MQLLKPKMPKTRRGRAALAMLVGVSLFIGLGASACESQPSTQESETQVQQDNYDKLAKGQPAHKADSSPTRDTINFWIDKWGHNPNKLSYVYLQGADGNLLGYYVFKGLPVSYCASLTPNYRVFKSTEGNLVLPAPAMDGVFYGGSGSCNTYYGRDASTNTYVEYTAGLGINVLLYDQPLPRQDVEPLGFTNVNDVKKE